MISTVWEFARVDQWISSNCAARLSGWNIDEPLGRFHCIVGGDGVCGCSTRAWSDCGPIGVLWFSMTFCRSRRRQVVEMHCCRLFCWAHNPKVGGSNPPPATNSSVWFRWVEPIHSLPR